jgi:hypothetical protein
MRSLEPERREPLSVMGSRRHKLRGPLIILIASIFAVVQPSATGAQAPPSSTTIRVLDPEEIKLLMKQGEQFIAAGDVVTDRIVFQRAAEAGNANAAMALGATYDPTVLAKLGVVGMGADVEKARSWYQTAENLGSSEARGKPSATGAQAPPSSTTIRVLDPEEIKLLMKQGEQFIAAGDVVTARIVFQRAAEAGNANAAMALGATYDPTVLAKLGVVGMGADVEKARSWYQKAENLGSSEARGRLEVLADRFVRPALGGCALTREPPYQLKSDTVDWTMQISSGQSCVRGLRHGRVTIHTAKLISSPQSGQVKVLGSGFSYTAKSDFRGQDSFTIQVSGMLNRIHGTSDIRIIASVGPK